MIFSHELRETSLTCKPMQCKSNVCRSLSRLLKIRCTVYYALVANKQDSYRISEIHLHVTMIASDISRGPLRILYAVSYPRQYYIIYAILFIDVYPCKS